MPIRYGYRQWIGTVGIPHAGRDMIADVQTAYHNADANGPWQVALEQPEVLEEPTLRRTELWRAAEKLGFSVRMSK